MELYKFKELPNELINIILNYTNIVTFRHGKYIDRLSIDDERCKLLNQIPKPIKISQNVYNLFLIDKDNLRGIVLQYRLNKNFFNYKILECNYINITFVNNKEQYNVKKHTSYCFDINNKWYRTIKYSM
jgi:hypothetical protein